MSASALRSRNSILMRFIENKFNELSPTIGRPFFGAMNCRCGFQEKAHGSEREEGARYDLGYGCAALSGCYE